MEGVAFDTSLVIRQLSVPWEPYQFATFSLTRTGGHMLCE